jgi:hypothetical protein
MMGLMTTLFAIILTMATLMIDVLAWASELIMTQGHRTIMCQHIGFLILMLAPITKHIGTFIHRIPTTHKPVTAGGTHVQMEFGMHIASMVIHLPTGRMVSGQCANATPITERFLCIHTRVLFAGRLHSYST